MEIGNLAAQVYLGTVFLHETRREVLEFCLTIGIVRHLFATESGLLAINADCARHFNDFAKIVEFFTNFGWDDETAERVSTILFSVRSVEQLRILHGIVTTRMAQLPPLHHTSVFDLGVARTILATPSVDVALEPHRIPPDILAQIFADTEFLAEVKSALAASVNTPGTPYRSPDARFQVVYNLPSDSFTLHIFDKKRAYADEATQGTSKNIKSTVLKIWIRNLLGWEFFLGAMNQDFVVHGWQLVSVATNSPIFRRAGSDPHSVLVEEGFTREIKARKSGEVVDWYVAPYKGVSLTAYKKAADDRLPEEFLCKLFYFLLDFIAKNHFVGISDLKPDNILYNPDSDTFTVIDYYVPDAVSPAFFNLKGYPSSPSTNRRLFALHILSDNVVFSIYHLLDRSGALTAHLLNQWLPAYLARIPEPKHLFFGFLDESIRLIAGR